MADDAPSDPDLAGVRLTSPDKILYPDPLLSKLQLARYLLAVSAPMLDHVKGRPLSLVRCPEGVKADCFFQKHTAKGMPPALKGVPVKQSSGAVEDYILIDGAAGLVAAAQIEALEIHIWGAHWKSLEHPDRLVFDLDPDGGVTFADVRAAARDVRNVLQAAGLVSFALVTGGKGIHIVAPLDASQGWDEIKRFARGVAARLAESEPHRFTATAAKAERKDRIFIDWLRNERGATAIAPYSPRAHAMASVALPVAWHELDHVAHANAFTIPEVLRRLEQRRSDPWSGYVEISQKIGSDPLRAFA